MVEHDSERLSFAEIACMAFGVVTAPSILTLASIWNRQLGLKVILGAGILVAGAGLAIRYNEELFNLADKLVETTKKGRERLMKWGNLLGPSLETGVISAIAWYAAVGTKGVLIGTVTGVLDYLAKPTSDPGSE